jgi:hypothetical protein
VAEVTVDIGGLRTAIATRDRRVAGVVSRRYAGFLSAAPADWRIEAGLRPGGVVPLEDVVVRAGDGPGRLVVERHDFLATLDLVARTGTLALGAVDRVAVDTFLRVAYSLALLDAGALLVHAASLGRGARAWLFAGPSGSGKTTLTRVSPGATLLSDEISIVRLEGDRGVRCHGSPFWGELARAGENTALPLAAIHVLRHADRHAATPMSPRAALAALLPNVLFFAAVPALVARVLDVAAALVERVPCFSLGFRPDASVWEAIEHAA